MASTTTAAANNNNNNNRISLPGFGRALNDYPHDLIQDTQDTQGHRLRRRLRFPHVIEDECSARGVSMRERRMIGFINVITDKPEWTRKVFDEEIVAKWRAEALGPYRGFDEEDEKGEEGKDREEERELNGDVDGEVDEGSDEESEAELNEDYLTEPMFSYCIKELRDKAEYYKAVKFVSILDCELAVVKSDETVPETLQQALRQAVRVLEDVPDHQKYWHPGSDGKVLDLVHPSLFPLIYGVSRALPCGSVPLDRCMRFCCAGEVVNSSFVENAHSTQVYGQRHSSLKEWGSFQWLPSEVRFAADDGRATITSYVNNLHPDKHQALYPILEQFVDAAIPLWDECLSWFRPRLRLENIKGNEHQDYDVPADITYTPDEDEAEDVEIRPYTFAEVRDRSYDFSYEDSFREWFKENRFLKQTAVREFRTRQEHISHPDHLPVHLKRDFAAAGLQVIFKLANIHLTPEKPKFKGGSWHIEGALNEHICASTLYYYDEDNITSSYLYFRQGISDDVIYIPDQDEYSSTEEFYGVEQGGPAIQHLGGVLTRPGRLLAFPNVLQHQVQPFSLADATKPGHRKILALFLVDPHIRVLSTANIAPQRVDWWAEQVRALPPFNALPVEIFHMIVDLVGEKGQEVPLSWEDALRTRQELMDQRGALVEQVNDDMEENTFSFCEH